MIAAERRLARKLEQRKARMAVVRQRSQRAENPGAGVATGPTYYNVPLLKPPVWKWEVPVYFFLGGLSAGAHLLARAAERFGRGKHKDVTRAGELIALG